MGHVVLCLSRVARVAPETLQAARGAGGAAGTAGGPRWAERWARFHRDKLQPLLDVHETPLVSAPPHSTMHTQHITNILVVLLCPNCPAGSPQGRRADRALEAKRRVFLSPPCLFLPSTDTA